MKPRILVLGSSNTDMIIRLDRIPKPGETILGGEFVTAAGGKGANQAVGAARAGGKVTFIARVGRDMFGEQAVAGFVRDGINVDHIVRDASSPSGVALIFVAMLMAMISTLILANTYYTNFVTFPAIFCTQYLSRWHSYIITDCVLMAIVSGALYIAL